MIDIRYYLPAHDLRDVISSYYILDFDVPRFDDVLQAEQANVRFPINGRFSMRMDGRPLASDGPVVFGARTRPIHMAASGPGLVFGAGILPHGLLSMFGLSAEDVVETSAPLDAIIGHMADRMMDLMSEFPHDGTMVDIANRAFRRLKIMSAARVGDPVFQHQVQGWLTGRPSPRVDDLVSVCDVSARQVERLCRRQFGITPKRLARKSRVLKSALALSLDPSTSWQDVAAPAFCDQSHFIREFKSFTGMTPRAYAQARAPVMGQSVRRRSELALIPPLALLS
ncbi:MAG: AraC family transcriptional regulator [Pseudomonadota bacterium]